MVPKTTRRQELQTATSWLEGKGLYSVHAEYLYRLSFRFLLFLLKQTPFKKFLRATIRVSNSSDPDQPRLFVKPDLGPNYLQRLSTDKQDTFIAKRAHARNVQRTIHVIAHEKCMFCCHQVSVHKPLLFKSM